MAASNVSRCGVTRIREPATLSDRIEEQYREEHDAEDGQWRPVECIVCW